jgi:translation initiation factor IF-1
MDKDVVKKEGVVREALQGGLFRIELGEGEVVLGVLSGRMRKYRIRVMAGDKVLVEFSPHDLMRGRISLRL